VINSIFAMLLRNLLGRRCLAPQPARSLSSSSASSAVRTRLAEPRDYEAAMRILQPFIERLGKLETAAEQARARALFDELCTQRRGAVTLAEDATSGALLGVATQSFNVAMRYAKGSAAAEYSCLEELIVGAAGRGKGVGKVLVQATIDAARRRGCARMGLYVASGLTSQPFYEKIGFVFDENGPPATWGHLQLSEDGGDGHELRANL
jgi:GNAT superfamily N-acetyltransferase